jgi:hypothetical protein
MDRADFLRWGAAGAVAAGGGVLAGPAAAALPPPAPQGDDVAFLAFGAVAERASLLVGVYLNGAAFARDSATRLLLGRLLAYDAQQLAWMRNLAGVAAGGLPNPVAVEQAGAQLDRLITTPAFTS